MLRLSSDAAMAEEKEPKAIEGHDEAPHQDVTAGKGRRDEVGHTPVYPATGPYPDDPDAKVLTPGEMGHPVSAGPPVPIREDGAQAKQRDTQKRNTEPTGE